jgi:ACS family tartrate transporter-like MFS transporter
MQLPLDRARRKAYWRLTPLLFASFVISYIDRANVSIAKLTMVNDLPGFDNAVFGLGYSMFFAGYVLLEIPSGLIVERWGASRWIGRIMITWGIAAAAQAAVRTPNQFYVARFLLGLAEAGFVPGVIVFISHWFPARDRGRVTAIFFAGPPVAQLVNPKISNFLLTIGTPDAPVLGLVGWQWLFIVWALPAIGLGLLVLFVLPDRPRNARWLDDDEREALQAELAREKESRAHMTFAQALRNPRVLVIAGSYLCAVVAFYGLDFFVPSILSRWYGLDMSTLTWLLVLVAGASLVGQLFTGWNSDRVRERRLHAAVPLALAAGALALVPYSRGNLAFTVTLFLLATVGTKAYLPAFWCLPTLFLSGVAAAGSAGFINTIGNLGGLVGSYGVGKIEAATGSFEGGMYFIAAAAAVAAVGLSTLRFGSRRQVHSGEISRDVYRTDDL